MVACMFDVCMVMTYGSVLKNMFDAYPGCMILTLEYGLRHFLLRNNAGYDSEVMEVWS
jgi:hypothetical protein